MLNHEFNDSLGESNFKDISHLFDEKFIPDSYIKNILGSGDLENVKLHLEKYLIHTSQTIFELLGRNQTKIFQISDPLAKHELKMQKIKADLSNYNTKLANDKNSVSNYLSSYQSLINKYESTILKEIKIDNTIYIRDYIEYCEGYFNKEEANILPVIGSIAMGHIKALSLSNEIDENDQICILPHLERIKKRMDELVEKLCKNVFKQVVEEFLSKLDCTKNTDELNEKLNEKLTEKEFISQTSTLLKRLHNYYFLYNTPKTFESLMLQFIIKNLFIKLNISKLNQLSVVEQSKYDRLSMFIAFCSKILYAEQTRSLIEMLFNELLFYFDQNAIQLSIYFQPMDQTQFLQNYYVYRKFVQQIIEKFEISVNKNSSIHKIHTKWNLTGYFNKRFEVLSLSVEESIKNSGKNLNGVVEGYMEVVKGCYEGSMCMCMEFDNLRVRVGQNFLGLCMKFIKELREKTLVDLINCTYHKCDETDYRKYFDELVALMSWLDKVQQIHLKLMNGSMNEQIKSTFNETFEDVAQTFNALLNDCFRDFVGKIHVLIQSILNESLNIPRLYRKTNRQNPSKHLPYVDRIESILTYLNRENTGIINFHEIINHLIQSWIVIINQINLDVGLIDKNLNKYRKSRKTPDSINETTATTTTNNNNNNNDKNTSFDDSTTSNTNNRALSDVDKMNLQIYLDVSFLTNQIKNMSESIKNDENIVKLFDQLFNSINKQMSTNLFQQL